MKKIGILLVMFCMTWMVASAQEVKDRPKYRNLSFVQQTLKTEGGFKLKSDYGGAFTTGRTYYFHKKPILGLLRFGFDWTYLDLNFAYYEEESPLVEDAWKVYQLEAGMHFGPSITLSPVKNLKLNAYFRYAPSFSGAYDDAAEDFYYSYGSFYVSGAAISYKVISLGVEKRWGESKFKIEDEDENSSKVKFETTGTRFYLSFRF